jgi:hypothetical protein
MAFAPNVSLTCGAGTTLTLTLQSAQLIRVNFQGTIVLTSKTGPNVYTSGPKYKLTHVVGGWNWKAPGVNVTCH